MLRRMWRSTSGLVAIVAMGFTVATLGIGIAAYGITHEALEEQLDHRIANETAALLGARPAGIADLAAEVRRRDSARSTASLEYLLIDTAGSRLAGSMIPDSAITEGYEEFFRYHRSGKRGVAQALATPVPGGTLVVAADRDDLTEIDRMLATLFTGALIAMLITGIGSATLIGLATRRRFRRIETTARAIMAGEFARRVPRDGSGSEFDRLAGVLNQMLERIEGLLENLREVSSDVAHDLRTPLTRLYHSLDRALLDSAPESRIARIDEARTQAAELLELFSAILRISEIESLSERLPRQELNLSELVEQMADSYRPDMEDSGHLLRSEVEPGLSVSADRRLLSQAIANLLDNTLRHTPPGTAITLRAQRAGAATRIVVEDDGPGVDAAELERLFRRFTRSERSRSTPGHGLGLALVAAVAAAHGGRTWADSSGGFRVVIELP
ncbi:MAG: ATP-binding protein [Steroidobacteraceae bacterium]